MNRLSMGNGWIENGKKATKMQYKAPFYCKQM